MVKKKVSKKKIVKKVVFKSNVKTTPTRACNLCEHSLVCAMRMNLSREINKFILLAEDQREQMNSSVTHNTGDLFFVLAGCCTGYKLKESA